MKRQHSAGEERVLRFLSRGFTLEQELSIKLELLSSCRERAARVTASLSQSPRGSALSDRVAECAAQAADLENEIALDYGALLAHQKEILGSLRALPAEQTRLAIELKYLHNLRVPAIAERLCVEERTVYRLLRLGIRQLDVLQTAGEREE